jgi:hypothetical protein
MNYYYVNGADPSADDGTWVVVVKAKNREDAIQRAGRHLAIMGRADLRTSCNCGKIAPSDDLVLFSTVEGRL